MPLISILDAFYSLFKRFSSFFKRKSKEIRYLPKPKKPKGNGKIVSFRRRSKK